MRESSRRFMPMTLSVMLVFVLAVSGALLPGLASASNSDLSIKDAESAVKSSKLSLEEAQAELDRLSAEYKTLDAEIQEMQVKIDETAQKVLDAQDRMLEGRAALGNTARQEYKNSSSSMFIGMLLGSNSFEELTQNAQYINQIMDYHSDEIVEQKQLKADLDQAANELNAQKSEQEAKLNTLESKQTEAQGVVDRISDELKSNTERLEALKSQAAAMKRQEQQAASTANPAGSSGSGSSSKGSGSGSSSNSGGSSSAPSGEGWRSGPVTAYGGSTDPNTNPNNLTAAGEKVTDSSMGVAIPLAWGSAEWKRLKGRTVEIRYNGQTVYGVVNDRGGMAGGARHLDLQPGIFRAFGYSSCKAWGVRTVQYRFL